MNGNGKPEKQPASVRVALRVPPWAAEDIDAIAEAVGITRSDVMREYLLAGLRRDRDLTGRELQTSREQVEAEGVLSWPAAGSVQRDKAEKFMAWLLRGFPEGAEPLDLEGGEK